MVRVLRRHPGWGWGAVGMRQRLLLCVPGTVWTEWQLELKAPGTQEGLPAERAAWPQARTNPRDLCQALGSVGRLPRAVVPGQACSDAIKPVSRNDSRQGLGAARRTGRKT